jgi:deoxyribonuclease V
MRLCLTDAHYVDEVACAACVLAGDWRAQFPDAVHAILQTPVAPYRPGHFLERELPPLCTVLEGLQPDVVVVDGYVTLRDGRPGLGGALATALGVPVVGVAKAPFADAGPHQPLYRGGSARPLWVSAVGIPLDDARTHVASMHGAHRIPTLLALADRIARQGRVLSPP